MRTSLDAQALETARHYDMLSPGSAVVIGLSGGADSVALLHWLCSLREERSLDLCAAHLNHGLRSSESDGDEAFCRALCECLAVPLHVKRVDLSGLDAGVEEAGRNARYVFFTECAMKAPKAAAPPQVVALAHTLSDRMETFLMNAGRGSALRGLCSIPPVRQCAHSTIIRPLIECSRAQVEEYCAANSLSYRTDSTNADTGYRRNRIRHEVMASLGWEAGPLRRLFRSLEADEAYLKAEAEKYEGDAKSAPEALKGRLLRDMLAAQGREPSQARIKELDKQWHAEKQGSAPQVKKIAKVEPLDEYFIKNLPKIPKEGLANCLDCDTIVGNLVSGYRLPGDRMCLCNGAGTKSFKKLCQERGIPPQAREYLLVARDQQGLVWMEGFGCAHRCRITGKTRRAIRIIANEQIAEPINC